MDGIEVHSHWVGEQDYDDWVGSTQSLDDRADVLCDHLHRLAKIEDALCQVIGPQVNQRHIGPRQR